MTRPGPIGVAPLLSSIATRARRGAAGDRVEARQLSRVVEQHAVEADVAAVELDRGVDVPDADADVVDSHERAHAASTGSESRPASTMISRSRRRLASSVTGRRGGRTSPPGWPSICISALSWLW